MADANEKLDRVQLDGGYKTLFCIISRFMHEIHRTHLLCVHDHFLFVHCI